MNPLRILLAAALVFVVLAGWADASRHRHKLVGDDEETGTRFSIIDEEDLFPMFQKCLGRGAGPLEVFGEVPANISLADDASAQALVNKAMRAARKACPKFQLDLNLSLKVSLLRGRHAGRDASPVVVAEWKLADLRSRKVTKEYRNAEAQRAKEETMIASGEIRPLPNNDFLFFIGTDTETGTKFWIYSQDRSNVCWTWTGGQMDVIGEVPKSIYLASDEVARRLVMIAAQHLSTRCKAARHGSGRVFLVHDGYQVTVRDRYTEFIPVQINAKVWGGYLGQEWPKVDQYQNFALEGKQREAAKERQAARDAARQERWNEFARKHGVHELADSGKLFRNPFLYQGKTIGVFLRFDRMMTANSAIFDGGGGFGTRYASNVFVVSNIPITTYKQSPVYGDVLAVRFLGMTEIRGIPFVESMKVPNLRFVGVHFCQEWDCSEMLGDFLHR